MYDFRKHRGMSGPTIVLGSFRCKAVPLNWIIIGHGAAVLAAGAGGMVWIFFLSPIVSIFFLPLPKR